MAFSTNEFPFSSEYDSDLREVLKYIREVVAKINTYDEIIAELKEELENIQDFDNRLDVLESATCVTIAIIFKLSINLTAVALSPLRPNEITPQVLLGIYFC